MRNIFIIEKTYEPLMPDRWEAYSRLSRLVAENPMDVPYQNIRRSLNAGKEFICGKYRIIKVPFTHLKKVRL